MLVFPTIDSRLPVPMPLTAPACRLFYEKDIAPKPGSPTSPAARFRWTRICDTGFERCPTRIFQFSGPLLLTGGRPERARRSAEAARAAHSAKRRGSVVLELLRGADLKSTSCKYVVTAAALSEWRDAILAAGAEALKVRQEDLVDKQGRRMKLVIAKMAMEIEFLRERIWRMEDEKPFLPWRSSRWAAPARPLLDDRTGGFGC